MIPFPKPVRRTFLVFLMMLLPLCGGGRDLWAHLEHEASTGKVDLTHFSEIPVLYDGRIRPMDSFAELVLYRISGSKTWNGRPAVEWLAETLFDPARALHMPVIRVERPEKYNLPQRANRLYTQTEVARSLTARKKELKNFVKEKDIFSLLEAQQLHLQLLRSLSMMAPLPVELTHDSMVRLFPDGAPQTLNFLSTFPAHDAVKKAAADIFGRKGEDLSEYTPTEKGIVSFAWQLGQIQNGGQANKILKILPPPPGSSQKEKKWQTPWQYLLSENHDDDSRALLELLKDMYLSYENGHYLHFHAAGAGFSLAIGHKFCQADCQYKLQAETLHRRLAPLDYALYGYSGALAFILIAAAVRFRSQKSGTDSCIYAERGALILTGCAMLCHAADLGLRTYILERPPVGTLYDTVVFICFAMPFAGFLLAAFKKTPFIFPFVPLCAAGGLLIAQNIEQPDILGVLSAVLNTNFWLALHVICILLGYAACLLASVLAHTDMFRRVFSHATPTENSRLLHFIALNGLALTAAGTLLGGFWADQSWGRFWGWDPKENGALLIILWLTWVLHGRIAGKIGDTGFQAGIALTAVIVALSWFGVNLLGAGLHSYGFTSGLAYGLAAFCTFEILLVGSLCLVLKKKEKRK